MENNKAAVNPTSVKPCYVLLDRNEVKKIMNQTRSKELPVEPSSAVLPEHFSKPTVIPPVCSYLAKYNDTDSFSPKRRKLEKGVRNAKKLPSVQLSEILEWSDASDNTTTAVISLFVTPKLRSDIECAILKMVITQKIKLKNECIQFYDKNAVWSVTPFATKETPQRRCRICDYKTPSYKILYEHYRNDHGLILMCTSCGNDELSFYQFHEHLVEKHDLKKKVHNLPKLLGVLLAESEDINFFLSCLFCVQTYSGKCMKILNEYISKHKVHHICKLCGLKFSDQNTLQTHIINHPKSIPALVCSFCKLEFRRLKIIQKHLETDCIIPEAHSKSLIKDCYSYTNKYIPKPCTRPDCKYLDCPFCSIKVEENNIIFLFKHINIHKSEICTVCSESFVPQVYLNFSQEHEPVCERCIVAENSYYISLNHTLKIATKKEINIVENACAHSDSPKSPLSITSKLKNSLLNSPKNDQLTMNLSAPSTSCGNKISVPSSSVTSKLCTDDCMSSDQGKQNFEIRITIVWAKNYTSVSKFSKVFQASDLLKYIEEEAKRDSDTLISYWCKYCSVNLQDYTSLYNHVECNHQVYFSSKYSNEMELHELHCKMKSVFGSRHPMSSYIHYMGDLIDTETNLKYSCLICHELFPLASIFSHVTTVHPYCRTCGQPFETFEQLSMHILDHEDGKIKHYNCKICSLELKSVDSAKEHLDNEHRLKSQIYYFSIETKDYINIGSFSSLEIPCPYCLVILDKKRTFLSHVKSHVNKECEKCEKSYIAYFKSKMRNAFSHDCYLFSKILETDPMLKPSGCSNPMKYYVVKDEKNVLEISYIGEIKQEEEEIDSTTCLYCNMHISSAGLYDHVMEEHHCCRICSLPFPDFEDWIKHRIQHEKGQIMFYKCIHCLLELKSYKCLESHFKLKGHDATSFFNSSGYTRTQKYLLVEDEAKLFKCPYCCHDFPQESYLIEHISNHTVLTCSNCNSAIVPSCEDVSEQIHFLCTSCILAEGLKEVEQISDPFLLEPEFVSVNQFINNDTSSIKVKTEIDSESKFLLIKFETDNDPSICSTETNDESSLITFDHVEIKSEVISEEDFLVS